MATVQKKWCVTDPVAETIAFDWTIENFRIQCRSGRALKSSCFSCKTAQWFLVLDKESDCSYVSVYVSRSWFNSEIDVVAWFEISIGKDKVCTSRVRTFGVHDGSACVTDDQSDMSSFGYDEYMLYSDIKRYLVDGSLTIRCELKILHSEDSYHRDSESLPVSKHTWKDDMASLMQDGASSDVTLVAGGKELNAHKLILSARSPVFARMFQHNTRESITNTVTITDITAEVLEAMLQFVYTDDCAILQKHTVSDTITRELLIAADKYQLEQLKTVCENELSKTLSIPTVAETLVYADMHNAQHLKQSCIRLIVSR